MLAGERCVCLREAAQRIAYTTHASQLAALLVVERDRRSEGCWLAGCLRGHAGPSLGPHEATCCEAEPRIVSAGIEGDRGDGCRSISRRGGGEGTSLKY
jgi:hypothetical protein